MNKGLHYKAFFSLCLSNISEKSGLFQEICTFFNGDKMLFVKWKQISQLNSWNTLHLRNPRKDVGHNYAPLHNNGQPKIAWQWIY